MDFLNNSNLHHAYLLIGQPEDFLSKLRLFIGKRLGQDDPLISPDYAEEDYPLFGIKDSHSLRQRQSSGAFGQNGRFFVLKLGLVTVEAQNALLKTLEEPTGGTHFFVILRSEDVLLPTLKSRFIIIRSKKTQASLKESESANGFLELSPIKRLQYVRKEFIKNKTANKGEVFHFLDDLEKKLYKDLQPDGREKSLKSLTKVCQARRYLASPRSSIRLTLEHLAITI